MPYNIQGSANTEVRHFAGTAFNLPDWVANTDYLENDMFVEGGLVYTVIADHTSPAVFDSSAVEVAVSGSEGLRGEPVADNTELTALSAKDYEKRKVLSDGKEYVFELGAVSGTLADDGATGFWQEQIAEGLVTTYVDSSAGTTTETLAASTAAGVVRLFTNEDVTNTATLTVQAGETLNGVTDGTFLFSNYSAGTQFRADEVVGGWVISVVGASEVINKGFYHFEGAFDNIDNTNTNNDFEVFNLTSAIASTGIAAAPVSDEAYYHVDPAAEIDQNGYRTGDFITLPAGTWKIDYYVDHPPYDITGGGASVQESLVTHFALLRLNDGQIVYGLEAENGSADYGGPSILSRTFTFIADTKIELGHTVDADLGANNFEDFAISFTAEEVKAPSETALAGMVTPTAIAENRFVATANNTTILSGSPAVFVFEAFTDTLNSGSIATYDGTNLVITAGANDIDCEAFIHTDGGGTHAADIYFRDAADAIGTKFGDGVVTDGVSSRGVYGLGSNNIPALCTVKAGTTVTLNLVQTASASSQVVKTGSYIHVKEVVPQQTVVMPDAVPVENVRVLLGSAFGIASNSNVTISQSWGSLAAEYERVEFEFITTAGTLTIRNSETISTANWADGTRTVLNADLTTIVVRNMDIAGTTANLFLSGDVTQGDLNIYGIKSQKTVTALNPQFTEAKTLAVGYFSRGSTADGTPLYTITNSGTTAANPYDLIESFPVDNTAGDAGSALTSSEITTNTDGFTITQAGRYLLQFDLNMSPSGAVRNSAQIVVNGVVVAVQQTVRQLTANAETFASVHTYQDLTVGDVVQFYTKISDIGQTDAVDYFSCSAQQLPTEEYVTPGDVPVEDVEELVFSADTVGNGTLFNFGSYADLAALTAAGFDRIRFQLAVQHSDPSIAKDTMSSEVSIDTIEDDDRVAFYNDASQSFWLQMDGLTGGVINVPASGVYNGQLATVRITAIKAQKTVINTTDVEFNDQSSSGYYDIGLIRHQWGIATGANVETINFPALFASPPNVVATPQDTSSSAIAVNNITTTGVELRRNGGSATHWQAIGLKP